jgi:GNAT superfamily N-acetyltransferase
MYWRLTRREFTEGQGEGNRRALKQIVDSGRVPGILAYSGREPVGWCSVAPREDFPSLERSTVLKRLDDKPVWSIVCFYIARGYRGKGVGEGLIGAAVAYVKRRGGKIVEAYPPARGAGPWRLFPATRACPRCSSGWGSGSAPGPLPREQ